jgi:ribosome-binding protein aMBF1 (putative translation factor)
MAKRKTLMDNMHEDLQGNQEFNARFQCELTRLQLADQILKLRERGELSQAQLARKIGTHQSAVARMEQSTYRGYTVATLAKIAGAAGARLEVRFVPRGRRVQQA